MQGPDEKPIVNEIQLALRQIQVMNPHVKVFISYAREDLHIARRVFAELVSIPGVELWLDVENILPGADWNYEITTNLEDSDLVLVLLSSSALDKRGYIQKEIHKILDLQLELPPGHTFCVPVRLDECRPRHPELKKLQWIDLFRDWNMGLAKIRQLINQRRKVSLGEISQHLESSTADWRGLAGVMVTRTWQAPGHVYIVREGRNYIGSGHVASESDHPTCDIFMPVDAKLSSEHALIQVWEGSYEIYDMGSEHGTFLNGELLVPLQSTELPNYSEILTGATIWQFVKLIPPTW